MGNVTPNDFFADVEDLQIRLTALERREGRGIPALRTGLDAIDTRFNPTAARVYVDDAQSLTAGGTPTTVTFGAESYDIGSTMVHTTGIYTCPEDGIYAVDSAISVTAPANTERFIIQVWHDPGVAVEYARGTDHTFVTGAHAMNLHVSAHVEATATDTIYIRVHQVNGTGRALGTGFEQLNYFNIARIA